MRESRRRLLIWQGAALLSYFVGMLLFLVVAMGIVGPERSLATLTTGDWIALAASVCFLGIGGLLNWKSGGAVGGDMGPIQMGSSHGLEPSRLEELGYQMPPEWPDDSETADRGAVDHDEVRCPACGTTNDRSFTYCRQCSSELHG